MQSHDSTQLQDANDSHSAIVSKFSKFMSTAKTVFHLTDDPLVATEKALNITNDAFMLAADVMVASVFLIVSAIEFHESLKEWNELNEEYAEVKEANDEETRIKKSYLKKHMNICIANILLSGGALIASITLLACTAATLAFGGMAFFPFAIMMAILMKQSNEFYILNDELKELQAIPSPTLNQTKKIAEIQNELFYKKMEITAQALITFGFLTSVVAVSVLSAGMAPTLFVIGGAIFGLIFKLHGKYHEHIMEKKALEEKVEVTENKLTVAERQLENEKDKNLKLQFENIKLQKQIKESRTDKEMKLEISSQPGSIKSLIEKEAHSPLRKLSLLKRSQSDTDLFFPSKLVLN